MNRENSFCRWVASTVFALTTLSPLSAQSAAPAEDLSAEAAAAAVGHAFAYDSPTDAGDAGRPAPASSISIDLRLLATDPDQLRVELPDGRVYIAVRSASWTEAGDRRYWSGELHPEGFLEKAAEGTLSLSAESGIVAGSLRAGGLSFEIVPLAEGKQQLIPSAPSPKGAGGGAPCELRAPASEAASDEPARLVTVDGEVSSAVVDVLVVFPRSLAATATQLMQTRARIALWFGDANRILANSDVDHRFRMLYAGPLYGSQPNVARVAAEKNTSLGIDWLRQNPTEVVGLRDNLQADLVALFVPPDTANDCGAALVDRITRTGEIAAIDIGCASGEFLVAHELGHLLGMRHAPGEGDSSTSPHTFSSGYDRDNALRVNGQRAATVMACNGDNNGAANSTLDGIQCNRIPYYSNPTLSVGGVAIGTSIANNAEVARLQMPVTAQLRPSINTPNLPPRVTIVSPQGVRAQSGQYLTLSAGAFDTEDGRLDANIRWSSNRRGYLGTGPALRVLSNLLGPETITATVADSGSLTHSRSVTVTFESLVVTEGAIWHDPNFPGRFLSFNKNIHNVWIATWMAYEGASPVWYLTGTHPLASNGSFSGQLQRFTRNVTTLQLTPSNYGSLSIAVETERQIRLVITPLSGPRVELLLEPYTRVSNPGGYISLVGGQVDPGWVIFRGPTVFGGVSGDEEARFVATYDGTQPVWAFGLGRPPSVSSSPFRMNMFRPTPATVTDNYRVPNSSPIGELVFFFSPVRASISLRFPSNNNWIRPAQAVEGFVVR